MLPKQVTDLTDGFVRVFDSEHPATIEFRKAHNKAAESLVQRGFGSAGNLLYPISKEVTAYLEKKAQFVWDKLQQVITSTEIESYPELNTDLKSQVASYFNPTRQAAEYYMEEIRRASDAPTGYTTQIKVTLDNILLKVSAEVDLFCAKYAMNEKKKNSLPTIIYNLSGDNARVNIGSTDVSINIANSEKIFCELKKTIENGVEDNELKEQLLAKTADLEKSVGNKLGYTTRYSEWIALAANHMTLLGPWIPALTHFLTH